MRMETSRFNANTRFHGRFGSGLRCFLGRQGLGVSALGIRVPCDIARDDAIYRS